MSMSVMSPFTSLFGIQHMERESVYVSTCDMENEEGQNDMREDQNTQSYPTEHGLMKDQKR